MQDSWFDLQILYFFCFSHQDDRWSKDHYDRKKRQAEWDFSKDSFFCDVPGEFLHSLLSYRNDRLPIPYVLIIQIT